MKKVSEKQLKANRKNSILGGVRTKKGKDISKFNALKHGILRESITKYEDFDYEKLYLTLTKELAPQNTIEEILVERITSAYIKLMRVAKAEKEVIKGALDPKKSKNLVENEEVGYKPTIQWMHVQQLSLYLRYETATENKLYKAIKFLNKLQRPSEE